MERPRTSDDFKFNVALVNIDFLMRHDYLAPDDPGNVEIAQALNMRLPDSGGARD